MDINNNRERKVVGRIKVAAPVKVFVKFDGRHWQSSHTASRFNNIPLLPRASRMARVLTEEDGKGPNGSKCK